MPSELANSKESDRADPQWSNQGDLPVISVLSDFVYDLCLVLPVSLYAWAQLLVSAGERTDRTGAPLWVRMIASLKPWKRGHSGRREPAGLAQAWWWLVWIAFINLPPLGIVALAPFGHFPSEQPTLAAVVAVNVAALAVEAWLVAPAWIRLYHARKHPGAM
jgi:hypothetical protein